MTAKKKFNFKAPLEVFAKSIVQPMMYLSVAGILLIVGIILTNKTICAMIPVLGSGPFQLVGAVVYQSLMFIINNLSILFCVGIAGAMAKKNKGHASLIALMSFFLFLQANNIVLNATGSLAEASGMLGLTGTGQSTVMGIQVLDTGVFGGIILGCITGAVFNKYSNKQFPIALSMFSGVRFPFLRSRAPSPPLPASLRSRATSVCLSTACSTSYSFPPVCTTSSTLRSSSPMWVAP